MPLSDIDTTTWVVSIGVLAVCLLVAVVDVLDWGGRRYVRAPAKRFLLWIGAIVCAGMAVDALSHATDAKRDSVTGLVEIVQDLNSQSGAFDLAICVTSCKLTGIPLHLNPDAAAALKKQDLHAPVKVSFLIEREEIRAALYAFPVVDLANGTTGKAFYHQDTELHPVRAGFLLGDAALLLLTGLLSLRQDDSAFAVEDESDEAEWDPYEERRVSRFPNPARRAGDRPARPKVIELKPLVEDPAPRSARELKPIGEVAATPNLSQQKPVSRDLTGPGQLEIGTPNEARVAQAQDAKPAVFAEARIAGEQNGSSPKLPAPVPIRPEPKAAESAVNPDLEGLQRLRVNVSGLIKLDRSQLSKGDPPEKN